MQSGTARAFMGRLAMGAAALALLAVGGEAAFNHRDDGAFPHVNFYVPDPALGVRLEPHASMRLAFNKNPVTTVRTNSLGFRGAEWEAPEAGGPGGIIVVGDSQVFGLGVEEEQTASAVLAARLGAGAGGRQPVWNAGVPTYGFPEYLAVLEEQLAARRPASAVLVLNQSNDWFEYARPNRERHAVWDGWAVHVETMPESITEFPGRRWLYSQSHLFFALRRAWHSEWIDKPVEGLPSQGGLSDLIGAGVESKREFERKNIIYNNIDGIDEKHKEWIHSNANNKWELEKRLYKLYIEGNYDIEKSQLLLEIIVLKPHPGDIIQSEFAEASVSVQVTAQLLKEAAEVRKNMGGKIIQWIRENENKPQAKEMKKILNEMGILSADQLEIPVWESVLASQIEAFAKLCKKYGARPVLVTLPLDVVVDRQEWAKYGEDPAQMPDMDDTEIQLMEAREVAKRLGITVVDPMALLRAAEPGAFLYGDIHLSVTGQAALAQAIYRQAFPTTALEPATGSKPDKVKVGSDFLFK